MQSAKLFPTKRPILVPAKFSAKECLRERLRYKEQDERYLDAFLVGYCSRSSALETLDNWINAVASESMISKDKRWVKRLEQCIVEMCSKADVSQHILNKKAVEFLKSHPIPDNEYWIKSFSANGHCDGYAFFVTHFLATELDQQLKTHSDVETCWNNAWEKLKALFDKLSDFDKDSKEHKDSSDIANMLAQVGGSQHSLFRYGLTQGDWHKVSKRIPGIQFKQVDRVIDDFTEEKIRVVIENFFSFKQDQYVVNPAVSTSKGAEFKEPDAPKTRIEALRIGANEHATVFIKILLKDKLEPIIIYFDPNSYRLLQPNKTKNPALLAKLVCIAHEQSDFPRKLFRAQHFVSRHAGQVISHIPHLLEAKEFATSASRGEKFEYACKIGSATLFKKYLSELKDINAPLTSGGETPLIMAAKYCRPRFIDLLASADLEVKTHKSGRRALHILALFNQIKAIKVLLDRGASIDPESNPTMKPAMTPLAIAVRYGRVEAVDLLLSRGANKDFKIGRKAKLSLLHLAVERNHLEVAKRLIAYGANLYAVAAGNKTVLSMAKTPEMRALIQKAMREYEARARETKKAAKKERHVQRVLSKKGMFAATLGAEKTGSPVSSCEASLALS